MSELEGAGPWDRNKPLLLLALHHGLVDSLHGILAAIVAALAPEHARKRAMADSLNRQTGSTSEHQTSWSKRGE